MESFPSWERGLKLEEMSEVAKELNVVPLVGTWIEIVGFWSHENAT